MRKVFKYVIAAIGLVVLTIVGLGAMLVGQMQDVPKIDSRTQVTTKVYDETFLEAIEISRKRLDKARLDLYAPAISLAVSVDGKIVWAEARGIEDLETKIPVTLDSRFAIGSVSKTITAAAATLLSQQGQLDLDVDVRTYVPTFPEKLFPVTTRQLLSHQGGIRHYKLILNPPTFTEMALNRQFDSVTESLSIFAKDALLFEPDTSFNYSTFGYTLISAAIEGASGEPFLDHLQTTLFNPLGMTATSADYSDRNLENRVSDYVQLYPGAGLLPAPEVNVSFKWAGGGLISTPSDLVRFGSALMLGDIVTPSTLEEMMTPRQVSSGELNPQHYGLGWRIGGLYYPAGSDEIITLINHGGTAIGGVSILILMPDSGIVVAMCANSAGRKNSGPLTSEAAAVVRVFLDFMSDQDDKNNNS